MKKILKNVLFLFPLIGLDGHLFAQNVGINTTTPSNTLSVNGSMDVANKIGVGLSNPNAPLQFSNAVQNRKIVLWDYGLANNQASDDHRFFGFGINDDVLRYQSMNDHVFYSTYLDIADSKENFRIKKEGDITADGSMTIGGKLSISGINNTTTKNALSVNGIIDVSNKIGIGLSNPSAPLQFNNTLLNRKIVLWDYGLANNQASDDHRFFGFGINDDVLRYQSIGAHVFYSTDPFGSIFYPSSTETFRIKNNGDITAVGKLTVGSASQQPEQLYVNGHAKVDGDFTTTGFIHVQAIVEDATQIIPLQNSWVNHDGGFANASFWKDKESTVHIQGLIKNGNTAINTVLFTLPTGNRPTSRLIFNALSNNQLSRIDILSNGDVIIASTVSSLWLNLTGIDFRVN